MSSMRSLNQAATVILRTARLAAGAAFFLLASASFAEVPLEEFTKQPLYKDLKIIPTGEFLAATVRDDDGQAILLIMRTDGS